MTKAHPIIFSAPMVSAILDGRKTVTRRIIKATGRAAKHSNSTIPRPSSGRLIYRDGGAFDDNPTRTEAIAKCPYGVRGHSLWVRETFMAESREIIHYRADARDYSDCPKSEWKPSIHMPRWASRINLLVKSVRVERLHDITEADALAEGIQDVDVWEGAERVIAQFRRLWEEINGAKSWDANPWVWVISFNRVKP